MIFHVRNRVKRSSSFTHLLLHFTYLDGHSSFLFSSSSFPYQSDSYALRGAQMGSQEGGYSVVSKCFNFDAAVAKVRTATSVDEVVQLLSRDQGTSTLPVSDSIVNLFLHRFKDDWKSALGVFRWAASLPGYELNSESYDMMVDILGKAKQMDRMKEMVEEMSRANLATVSTIAKVMRRFAGAGKWEDAIRTFDDLETVGLEKNTETMNLLLDTLCKENRVEKARSVFVELKSHIAPNAHTFNIFIHGWCKINRADEAQWTIQEMKGHGWRPGVISYSTIIQSYCRQSNFRMVYELLDDMIAQGCPPNVVTYTTIMCSLAKSEDFELALLIPQRMKSVGCKPDVLFFNALIHTLGRANRLQEAIRVFEVEMPEHGVSPNTSTYNSMIAMFCHYGEQEEALEIFNDMVKSPFAKPDAQSYFPLLKSCFRTGKTDSLLGMLIDDMVNKHHISLDISTYTLLIHGLCRADRFEWAYLLFKEMIGQDLTPRYQTCRLLLDEIKQRKMYDAAELVEAWMKKIKSS